VGAAISLDAPTAKDHDFVRNSPKAFELAMRGIKAVRKAGILLQINVTAMEYNMDLLSDIIDVADLNHASIMLMYQLVPVGRGEIIEDAALDLEQNKRLLTFLRDKQKNIKTIVEPVAGPQYWPYLMERRKLTGAIPLALAKTIFHGCTAGRGFVYIKPNGDVWPCPFVPLFCGNVTRHDFLKIWTESSILQNLRQRETTLKGKCGSCRYNSICGGCRGRAVAISGDYLAEDPSCFLPERPRRPGLVAKASGNV
ncbi:MAG: SPASM domain-containing protein, partial [Desulfomonilaceae bacterium]